MNHLIVSREYPPCNYPQGGIGTYVAHVARLLAEHGETVHVIGERWKGAPLDREEQCDGRLTVHRVLLDRPLTTVADSTAERRILAAMRHSECPEQAFSWQVSRLAESLIEEADIDCIEAQEYEAPLYYFLLRRALGEGPRRQPPCLVHLHSPTQFICHYNDWDLVRSGYLTRKRLEDYVIHASDAALCPSNYLARQAERHYGLDSGSVAQIPLPKGDADALDRTAETWEHGTICYVGRMESRKGVFEWVDAAVAVARERRDLNFELIGSDLALAGRGLASVREAVVARVPIELRPSFRFLDAVPRPKLFERLAQARIAVVPSRWENFPNTCVEAMSTGLPVLASPHGGMVEMIDDGQTGWIAPSGSAEDLAQTLRRALDTPSPIKAKMGRAAAEAIRRLCNNDRTISEHLALRRELARRGAERSLRIPRKGSDLVLRVTDVDGPPKTSPADAVPRATEEREPARGVAIVCVGRPSGDVHESLGAAMRRTLRDQPFTLGIAVVPADTRIDASFAARVEQTLARHPSVAIVSTWTATGTSVIVRPGPARPYQWMQDDVSGCCGFRAEALRDLEWLWEIPVGDLNAGDVALALLLRGWTAITVPCILSVRGTGATAPPEALARVQRARLIAMLRAQFSNQVDADGAQLLEVAQSQPRQSDQMVSPRAIVGMSWRAKKALAWRAVREPGLAARWMLQQVRITVETALPRLMGMRR